MQWKPRKRYLATIGHSGLVLMSVFTWQETEQSGHLLLQLDQTSPDADQDQQTEMRNYLKSSRLLKWFAVRETWEAVKVEVKIYHKNDQKWSNPSEWKFPLIWCFLLSGLCDVHGCQEDGQGCQLGHVQQHHVLLGLLRVGGCPGPQAGPLYHDLNIEILFLTPVKFIK